MKPRARTALLDKNNAEQEVMKLRGGAAIGAAVGFLWLNAALLFSHIPFVYWSGIYFTALCSMGALISWAATLNTQANNALFRDREEAAEAVRSRQTALADRLARPDDFR